MAEQFNKDAGPCPIECVEIERGEADHSRRFKGQLWLGCGWLTVDQVRELRKWLDEVLP